jgi:hypothetical protein
MAARLREGHANVRQMDMEKVLQILRAQPLAPDWRLRSASDDDSEIVLAVNWN